MDYFEENQMECVEEREEKNSHHWQHSWGLNCFMALLWLSITVISAAAFLAELNSFESNLCLNTTERDAHLRLEVAKYRIKKKKIVTKSLD